jgi:uncharacterized membrane protein YhaH (DUF805 family)
MLDAIFSFSGRLNRIQYFLGLLGLGVALFVTIMLFFAFGGLSAVMGGAPKLGALALFALPVGAVWIWISLSLQARRIRDIGWNPLLVIGCWFAVGVLDRVVALAAPALAMPPLHQTTLLGGLINLAFAGALLFWPGGPEDDFIPMLAEKAPARGRPPPAAPAAPAAPARSATPATAGFGRRGL